jgi:hypothetical protein
MKDHYKEEVVKLSEKLSNFVLKYMSETFPEGEDTSDLINFVLSSHLSSAFSLMILFSSEHKEMCTMVRKFVDDLSTHISKMHPISNIEVIK